MLGQITLGTLMCIPHSCTLLVRFGVKETVGVNECKREPMMNCNPKSAHAPAFARHLLPVPCGARGPWDQSIVAVCAVFIWVLPSPSASRPSLPPSKLLVI